MPDLLESRRTVREDEELRASTSLGETDAWKWRRLTPLAEAELDPYKRDKAYDALQTLFQQSFVTVRTIEELVDYLMVSDFRLSAEDARAQSVLDAFWRDPWNDIAKNGSKWVQEYFYFGELVLEPHVNPINGHVRINFYPSNYIEDVIGDEEFPGKPAKVVLKGGKKPAFTVISYSTLTDSYEGDLFYFRTRHIGDQVRGNPRLLPLIDPLARWEDYLYNRLARRAQADAFWWDVELQGFSQAQIDEWLLTPQASPPKANSVIAHNERARWTLIEPSPQGSQITQESAFYRDLLRWGAGLANSQGRAARLRDTGEILDETVTCLRSRQREAAGIFEMLGAYAVQKAVEHGTLPRAEYRIRCITPQLGVRDMQRASGAVLRFTQALQIAQEREWITPEEASAIFRYFIRNAGVQGANVELPEEEKG